MGKYSKVYSSTKWRLREKFVLRPMECLTPTVKFDIFTFDILFHICLPPDHHGVNNIRATDVLKNANALSWETNSCKEADVATLSSG